MIDESTIEQVSGDTIEELVIDQLEESSMEERLQELERAMERLHAEERALLLSITGKKSRSTRSQRSPD